MIRQGKIPVESVGTGQLTRPKVEVKEAWALRPAATPRRLLQAVGMQIDLYCAPNRLMEKPIRRRIG